jgi:hypothetical protein
VSARTLWARNKPFLIVVFAIVAVLLVFSFVMVYAGGGDAGIEIGPVESGG